MSSRGQKRWSPPLIQAWVYELYERGGTKKTKINNKRKIGVGNLVLYVGWW